MSILPGKGSKLSGYLLISSSVTYRFASPLKRWNFEKMAPWQFWKSAWGFFSNKFEKQLSFFKIFWKKGPFSNWVWKNTPGQGPGGPGQGPGPRPQWGILSNSVWKSTFFFKFCWKWTPGLFSKMSPSHFFKVSPFHRGRKLPLMREMMKDRRFLKRSR